MRGAVGKNLQIVMENGLPSFSEAKNASLEFTLTLISISANYVEGHNCQEAPPLTR